MFQRYGQPPYRRSYRERRRDFVARRGEAVPSKTERYIDVKTVTAVKRCPVFVADALVFHTGDGRRAYAKVPVAIADTDLDGCKLIYNADALKGVI